MERRPQLRGTTGRRIRQQLQQVEDHHQFENETTEDILPASNHHTNAIIGTVQPDEGTI